MYKSDCVKSGPPPAWQRSIPAAAAFSAVMYNNELPHFTHMHTIIPLEQEEGCRIKKDNQTVSP